MDQKSELWKVKQSVSARASKPLAKRPISAAKGHSNPSRAAPGSKRARQPSLEDPAHDALEQVVKEDRAAHEGTEACATPIIMELSLPDALKLKLVEDWEFITREKKLVSLPREPNVQTLLEKFCASRARRPSQGPLYQEVADGLQLYFDKALGSILLYKFEKKQHEKCCSKGMQPSQVYGAEHLLRLCVKLPELFVQSEMSHAQIESLQPKLVELLKFLQRNATDCFLSSYEGPGEEYLDWFEQQS